jgi:hypothetical protein
MSEQATTATAPIESVVSPPASEVPQHSAVDETRRRLLQLASELIRTKNRRLLVEFLTLRRLAR